MKTFLAAQGAQASLGTSRKKARPTRYFPGERLVSEDESESERSESDRSDGEEEKTKEVKEDLENPGEAKEDLGKFVGGLTFNGALKDRKIGIKSEESSEGEYITEEEEEEEEEGEEEAEVKKEIKGENHNSSSEEYESSSSSESDPEPLKLLKPVFIRKGQRGTQGPQAPKVEVEETKKLQKKAETLKLIESNIRAEQSEIVSKYNDDGDEVFAVDDTDDLDPATELSAWKLRELKRVKRERDEVAEAEKELEEIEARRNMPEKERQAEEREIIRKQKEEKQNRAKLSYMQRYYHRGAFYQDDELLKRDYTQAVEDDYKDKSFLPKALQVRGNVGLRGQTKYRSLQEEDTSRDSMWYEKNKRRKRQRDDKSSHDHE